MKTKFFQWRIADWFRVTALYGVVFAHIHVMMESIVTASETIQLLSRLL